MTTVDLQRADGRSPDRPTHPPVLDIVVPAFNAEATLASSVKRLHAYLSTSFPVDWRITIADAGSDDATWPETCRLARELTGIRVVRVMESGRGRALRSAWESSDAMILAYLDVTVTPDLSALLPLIAPLLSGHSELAVGTRHARGARDRLRRTVLGSRVADTQYALKAIRRDRAHELLSQIRDQGSFFDTELVIRAERSGLRVHEVPIDTEPSARLVHAEDWRSLLRLVRRPRLARQVSTFAAIGVLSTLAYLALFVVLRASIGPFSANALSLAVTAVANTAANRRLTFGVTDREGMVRHQIQGAVVFLLALAITSGSLATLHAAVSHPGAVPEVSTLIVANVIATVVRFVMLRRWVFQETTAT